MPNIDIAPHSDFIDWQPVARYLITHEIPPEQVNWNAQPAQDLFAAHDDTLSPHHLPASAKKPALKVSRRFIDLARMVASHSNPERFDLLYHLLWRSLHGERKLLNDPLDPQLHRAQRLAKEVSRDRHKMRAFVRFREVHLRDVRDVAQAKGHHEAADGSIIAADTASNTSVSTAIRQEQGLFVAWFEPQHYILRLNADFFCRRFHNMDWSIVSPYQSIHWQQKRLFIGAGADPSQVPQDDALEDYWRCYYANIFNPARLKVDAMCREMPKKYWHNLPEASLIPTLINSAHQRTQTMLDTPAHNQGKLPRSTLFNRQAWLKERSRADQTVGETLNNNDNPNENSDKRSI